MKQEEPLSILTADQTAAILDHAPVAIYVSEVESRELLYANRLAKNLMFPAPFQQGLTCYQAMGLDQPCPFCNTDKMKRTNLLIRQFRHPHTQRVYQLSGKLIDWAGKLAHIEYISDITEAQEKEDQTKALSKELQATFSSIPCGLCVYRFDGVRISPVFHNPAFYEIMGYSKEHIQAIEQETDFVGVHPDDLAPLQEKIRTALQSDERMQDTYRVWNDRDQEYRFIHLEGSVKPQADGTKLLYGVYSDVSDQQRLEKELTAAYEKMQDTINAIPGGIAIYKVTDIFETKYFSDGVPELTGYTAEEYQELVKQNAAEMTYWEDTPMVIAKANEVIQSHQIATFEFRKQHRDGNIVWVRVQVKWMGEEDGCPLLHCVFHNITDLKDAQLEMEHLINSIPGGIASYRVEGNRFIPTFYSDGVLALTNHTKAEFEELAKEDAMNIIYEADRERVLSAAQNALDNGTVLDVSYRRRHKNGNLVWIHLNGRRMGPRSETMKFYAVLTGISAEAQLFQSIANETADGLYVIDKKNYDLLYANEPKGLHKTILNRIGQKCYTALHNSQTPCEFCTLNTHAPDGKPHEMEIRDTDRYYSTSFREIDWNGIPAYVKYIQDVTEEVQARREKERLEQYFQTVVKHLPGGVAVLRYTNDGRMIPEFLSNGFITMTDMTQNEIHELYQQDSMNSVHPADQARVRKQMSEYISSRKSHCELVYRMKKGDGTYLWVKNTLSMIQSEDGDYRFYASYHDMTKERSEKEQLRQQYNELIMQHYRTPGPDALIVGHCNITQNRILEILDNTDSDLLKVFGSNREQFFTGIASLVVDNTERQTFLDTYLNAPSLAAFERGDTELTLNCFIKLPKEDTGHYAQFKVILVETPDTGDVTGILTVTDVTEQTISDRILHQLSVASYDFVIDLNLKQDLYTVVAGNKNAGSIPPRGSHSKQVAHMLESVVVPKDREQYAKAFDPDEMYRRLKEQGTYTFAFSITDANGDIRTKNMTVSAVDLRLGRICLARTDITDSVREQQGLLNVVAYTFELLAFIEVDIGRLTLHTRQTVLENLPPFIIENYDGAVGRLANFYNMEESREEIENQFRLSTMLSQLEEKPKGYDFVFPCRAETELRYKQINVLWGDENHKTVCMVRADVTDMLAAERLTKNALEKALAEAEAANRAKSDFLSSMSHDIRTPMNAIMGMTSLAVANLGDPERVRDCLQKISFSSRHLLSLINDILDMSKIEHAVITLNRMKISLSELTEQLTAMMLPQAEAAGLELKIRLDQIRHPYFYGDALRINQILINILGNAIKFTPEGGRIEFRVEELPPAKDKTHVRYRFIVSDTGVGMSEEFLAQIFEPFTRNRNATNVEGTGLGLSITKGLVDLMNGEISVKSLQNQGSTFQVELECEKAEAETVAAETTVDSHNITKEKTLEGRYFLIAEDNAINAEILCELLKIQGIQTIVTPDGAKAVQAFQDAAPGTYDAILMDIQMPNMDGYEATRTIRNMNRDDAKVIPIIAMTANAFDEDIQMALEAGMTAHIAKPIDTQVLWSTLTHALTQTKEA